MSSAAPGQPRPRAGALLIGAVWVGLVGGLLEGAGWLVAQRLGRLTNLWVEIVWIAPFVDAFVYLLVAIGAVGVTRVLPPTRRLAAIVFLVALAASGNLVALALQSHVHPAAIVVLAVGIATVLTRGFLARSDVLLAFFRRTLPVVAGLVLAVLVGVEGTSRLRERFAVERLAEPGGSPPNVVVVIIDALRADHVSSYGYERPTSPFLDRLAAEGALMERALSSSPYSLPSHASLLSGLDPHEHGVEWLTFNRFADADYPSIAEALRERGYRTGAFSANPFWFTREQGFGRGFIRFEDFYHTPVDLVLRTVFGKAWEKVVMPRIGLEDVPGRVDATENTDYVLDWIARDDRHPFFAFINYFDVHDPYLPPQPYRGRFSDRDDPGGALNWRLGRDGGLGPGERESEIDAYDGALSYVDAEIERLVARIGELRPGEELLVVVTSDHGEAFGERGWYLHGKSLYLEEIHVPLLVHWPGRVPAGVRVGRPVTHASVPATILDLVSAGEAETFGAPSLVPLFTGADPAGDRPAPLSEMGRRDWVDSVYPVQHGDGWALWDPEWRYIGYDSLPEELYAWADGAAGADRADDADSRPVLLRFRDDIRSRRR